MDGGAQLDVRLSVLHRDATQYVADAGVDLDTAWKVAGQILARVADDTSEFWDEQQILRMDGKYLSRYDEGFLDALDIYEQRVRGE